MSQTLFDVARDILLPIVTLILGWLTNAYRNKQQKEKNVLDNVQQILDMKSREVERAQAEVDRAHAINDRQEAVVQRVEAKLDKKEKAIRKARNCDWVKSGHDCPITEADERYFSSPNEPEQHQQSPCESCSEKNDCQ